MASRDLGRFFFPGNPWPKGHRILVCRWTARIERSSGVWFDFHLESENYYAADKRQVGEEEDENLSSTASRVLWCNYHSLTFSSTHWVGATYGFQAGSSSQLFDFRRLSGKSFEIDNPPQQNRRPVPFIVYRWGHEDVAYQTIKFKRKPASREFAIDWRGRIGDIGFAGSKSDFPYHFQMQLTNVPFEGIEFPQGTTREYAFELAEVFVADARKYRFLKRKDSVALLPPA
jgi:hypothetical protein